MGEAARELEVDERVVERRGGAAGLAEDGAHADERERRAPGERRAVRAEPRGRRGGARGRAGPGLARGPRQRAARGPS